MQFTYRHFISAFDETEQMHLFAGWERTYISAVHILLPYGPFKVKHATERTKIKSSDRRDVARSTSSNVRSPY